jgi:hypothetical protein
MMIAVTTAQQRPLGRGVREIIPPAASGASVTAAVEALAALRTATVPVAALQAAVHLLDELRATTTDDATRDAAARTAELLRGAIPAS